MPNPADLGLAAGDKYTQLYLDASSPSKPHKARRFMRAHLLFAAVLLICSLSQASASGYRPSSANRLVGAGAALFHDATPPEIAGLSHGKAAWADYDNDGRLDFVLTDTATQIKLYHNDGGGAFRDTTPASWPRIFNGAPAWGDYDNDGLVDLLLAGQSTPLRIWLFHNDGEGAFHDATPPGLPFSMDGVASWADYDNDGRLDFLIAGFNGGNKIWLYHNDGGGNFHDATPAVFPPIGLGRVAWGDYDNDGLVDLLITGEGSNILMKLYHNDGSGAFHEVAIPGLPIFIPDYATVGWGDYDNDGFLDFILAGSPPSGAQISRLFHNDGGATFHEISDTGLLGLSLGDMEWADYDNDGLMDVVIVGRDMHLGRMIKLYRNTGGGQFADVTPPDWIANTGGTATWGDYDSDGRLDLLVTGSTNSQVYVTRLYHNDSLIANTSPGAPSNLSAANIAANSATLNWAAASDSQTPALGLSYNIRVGTSPGASDILSPMANTTVITQADGLRRIPESGPARPSLFAILGGLSPNHTYYWSVQAIDGAWAGGPFAAEGQFTTTGGGTPAPSPTSTSTATPATPTSSRTPTSAFTPTTAASSTSTPTLTRTSTRTPTSSATNSPAPTTPPSQTPVDATVTPSSTPTITPTITPTPTIAAPSGTPASTPTACALDFSDVPPGSTFYDYVINLACRGIVTGYPDGTFGPNNPLARGQLSKIVSNAAGYFEQHVEQSFEDVATGSTFHQFVERLFSRGYLSGYSCGGPGEPCIPPSNLPYFRPGANVTRGQISKIVASARGLPAPSPDRQTFEDVPETSTFWKWIEALAADGAISGYPCGNIPSEPCVPPAGRPYFRPGSQITRGQAAKIVASAFFLRHIAPGR